jgi:lipopolysaccharide export system protein LptA
MARLRASWLAAAWLDSAAAVAATPVDPHGPQIDDNQPIQLDAGPSTFDYKNSRLVFHSVKISQGALSVEADEATATGLDFKDCQWVFTGNVRIAFPDGSMQSDEARISFAANLIASAEVTGTPARFEQKREKSVARGRAARIVYQPGTGTLRLVDEAFLSDGGYDISANTIVYNIREQRVVANPDEQGNDRIRLTINPKKPDPKQNP